MAVAYAQTQPRFFGGAELSKHSALISNNTSAESPNDSDDDYDYVATLAEQIAQAMLDDDDCQEDMSFREQNVFESWPVSGKNVCSKTNEATAHDFWSNLSDLSSNSSQGRTSSQSLSSPMSVPFCGRSPTLLNRSNGQERADCGNCSGLAPVSSPGEGGALFADLEVSKRLSGRRGCLPYVSRQSNVALLPRLSTSPTATESFDLPAIAVPMVERTETSVNATSFPSKQVDSDGTFHQRHNHASLEWQNRGCHFANGRSRNNAGQGHRTSRDEKGSRPSLCYYSVQTSRGTSPLRSVPPEVLDRTGVHAVVTGYSFGRKGTTGTGVFLPRANSTISNQRRKSDGGLIITKAAQASKNCPENPKANAFRYGGEHPRKSNNRTEATHQ